MNNRSQLSNLISHHPKKLWARNLQYRWCSFQLLHPLVSSCPPWALDNPWLNDPLGHNNNNTVCNLENNPPSSNHPASQLSELLHDPCLMQSWPHLRRSFCFPFSTSNSWEISSHHHIKTYGIFFVYQSSPVLTCYMMTVGRPKKGLLYHPRFSHQ